MAAIDNLASAAQGIMMGDQAAEQSMLAQLQSMTATLGIGVEAAEVARQIPIASTLGEWNIAQTQYYREGLLPIRQEELRKQTLLTEQIGMTQELKRQLARGQTNIARSIADVTEEPQTEESIKVLQRLTNQGNVIKAWVEKLEAGEKRSRLETREPRIPELTDAEIEAELEMSRTDRAAALLKAHEAEIGTTPIGQIPIGPEATPTERGIIAGVERLDLGVEYINTQIDSMALQQGLTEQQTAMAKTQVQQMTQELALTKPIYDDFIKLYLTDQDAGLTLLSRAQSARGGKFPNYYGQMAELMYESIHGPNKDEAYAELQRQNNLRIPQIALAEYARINKIPLSAIDPQAAAAAAQLDRAQDTKDYYTARTWGWYQQDVGGNWLPLIGPDDYPKLITTADDTWRILAGRTVLDPSYTGALTKIEREFGEGLAAGLVINAAKSAQAGLPSWLTDPNQRTLLNIINQTDSVQNALRSGGAIPTITNAVGMFRRFLVERDKKGKVISESAYNDAYNGLVAAINTKTKDENASQYLRSIKASPVTLNIDIEIDKRLRDIIPKPIESQKNQIILPSTSELQLDRIGGL